jgi:uroporphyrin-3 C-methyltransferase
VVRDLDRVKAVSVVDVSTLTIKLDEVARQVDDLPLLAMSQRGLDAREPATGRAGGAAAAAPTTRSAPLDPNAGWWERVWHGAGDKWDQLSTDVWREARGLLRVTRIDHPEAALMAPEQMFFLRENLKLRLLNARLALLSRQFDTAQNDLREAQGMLERYFDERSRKLAITIELLRQVQGQARQVQVPRPDDTLAALSAVAR